MVDLLEYLRGDGRLYELVNNVGTSEIVQTQTEANNVFYHVKNSQWEELWADDVYLYRGADTSSGNGEMYLLSENNHYGSAWVPRWFEVGWEYRRTATVIWRVKSSGASIPSKPTGTAVTFLRFVQLHAQMTFQSGIQLTDVAELHALLDDGGHPAMAPWEKYFYAKGYGLVGFQDMFGGFTSWIAQKFTPKVMPQRVRETISWLTPLQKRYYLSAAPKTTPTGQFVLSQMPSNYVNVRGYPDNYGKDLGDLLKNDVVTLCTPEVNGWVMVQKNNESGWVSRQNGKVVFTPTGTPIPPTTTPLPTVSAAGQSVLTQLPSSWVNVRDYPNESGNDIGDLHKNDVVTLYTPDVNGWVYIDTGSVQGWVSRQDGKVAFSAIVDPTPIPPDEITPIPPIKPVGQFTLTQIPATWINVRTYPDTAGADVGDLHKGDVVTLYSPDVNGWVFIEMGDVRGWVSQQSGKVVFTAVAQAFNAPIPHDNLPTLPQVNPAGQYTVTQLPGRWINVRAYPDNAGADVGDLHKGDVVTLYTPDVNGWAFIETDATRGWVWLENGKVDFEAAAAPAAALAAQSVVIDASASSAIVPIDGNASSSVNSSDGNAMPTTKEDAIRMRDAFQHVEEGARKVRTELERLIGRMRE